MTTSTDTVDVGLAVQQLIEINESIRAWSKLLATVSYEMESPEHLPKKIDRIRAVRTGAKSLDRAAEGISAVAERLDRHTEH